MSSFGHMIVMGVTCSLSYWIVSSSHKCECTHGFTFGKGKMI